MPLSRYHNDSIIRIVQSGKTSRARAGMEPNIASLLRRLHIDICIAMLVDSKHTRLC
jgi:hypothetical protein